MFVNNEKNLFETNLNQYKSIKERRFITKNINVIGISVHRLTVFVKAAPNVNE